MSLASMSWISKALILAFSFAIFPLLITGMSQRGMKPEVTIAWWCVGIPIGIYALSLCGGGGLVTNNHRDFFCGAGLVVFVLILGVVIGAVMNTLYGQTMQSAPNPALAIAVINSSVVMAYLIAPLLHKVLPKVFPVASMSWTGAGGIIMILGGIVMISRAQ